MCIDTLLVVLLINYNIRMCADVIRWDEQPIKKKRTYSLSAYNGYGNFMSGYRLFDSCWQAFGGARYKLCGLKRVHTCNVTAYRNAVTLQETDAIRSYELNFHPVPHGVTVSCERYTLAFPVCYGSSGRW